MVSSCNKASPGWEREMGLPCGYTRRGHERSENCRSMDHSFLALLAFGMRDPGRAGKRVSDPGRAEKRVNVPCGRNCSPGASETRAGASSAPATKPEQGCKDLSSPRQDFPASIDRARVPGERHRVVVRPLFSWTPDLLRGSVRHVQALGGPQAVTHAHKDLRH
jgi:hypothetical protein